MDSPSQKKRVRSNPDESPEFDSPETKRIREDLLKTLEDSDTCTVEQDLDSLVKSFENEINPPVTSDSGDSRPDLEFLLEASDDELGLPPTTASCELGESVVNESVELSEFNSNWLDDEFGYGFEYVDGDVSFKGECDEVLDDGLCDYTDLGFRRTESLPV